MKKVTRILAAVVMVIVAAAVLVANTNGGMEFMNDVLLACSDCIIRPLSTDTQLS